MACHGRALSSSSADKCRYLKHLDAVQTFVGLAKAWQWRGHLGRGRLGSRTLCK